MIFVYNSKMLSPSKFLMVNNITNSIAVMNSTKSFWVSPIIGNVSTTPEMLGDCIGTYDEFIQLYPEYII